MAPPEGATAERQSYVVSMPDVCATMVGPREVPVPYVVLARLDDTSGTTRRTNFRGFPAVTQRSFTNRCVGNGVSERGMASLVKEGVCYPVEWRDGVLVEGGGAAFDLCLVACNARAFREPPNSFGLLYQNIVEYSLRQTPSGPAVAASGVSILGAGPAVGRDDLTFWRICDEQAGEGLSAAAAPAEAGSDWFNEPLFGNLPVGPYGLVQPVQRFDTGSAAGNFLLSPVYSANNLVVWGINSAANVLGVGGHALSSAAHGTAHVINEHTPLYIGEGDVEGALMFPAMHPEAFALALRSLRDYHGPLLREILADEQGAVGPGVRIGKRFYPKDYGRNAANYSAKYASEGEARAVARAKLGKEPVEVEPYKLRSSDGRWQYRAKPEDLQGHGPGDGPHIHLERLDPDTGEVLENWHLRW